MNPTGPTQETEFVLRRLGDAVPHSLEQFFLNSEVARTFPLVIALVAAALLLGLFVERLVTGGQIVRRHEVASSMGWLRWAGVALVCVLAVAMQGFVTRFAVFSYSSIAKWPPDGHPWVVFSALAIPAILSLLPMIVYLPRLSEESLKHHTPSRALMRALAGTAGYLTLIAFLDNFFNEDTSAAKPGSSFASPTSAGNQAVFWFALTGTVFALAAVFTFINYVRDLGWRSAKHWIELGLGIVILYAVIGGALVGYSFFNERMNGEHASPTALFLLGTLAVPALIAVAFPFVPKSMNVFWATVLSALRINVYGLLAAVFLLPSCQTWERTEKRSRVIILIDISPSMRLSDDIASEPNQKTQTRIDKVIDLLTDEKIALIQSLMQQNPVFVYRFGTRLDEETQTFAKGDARWTKPDWDAFTRYDFRAWLLRDLSEPGKQALRGSPAFTSEGAGSPDWAMDWLKKPIEESFPAGLADADREVLKSNREKLEKRVDVARSIVLGTNVPDSTIAAINRESSNMAQGVIVLTDGRSNLGSDTSFIELKERATREQIPVFTIAVGEDRQTVAITITDIVAPDRTPPDDAFKIAVEADGVNLANQSVEVKLGLFMPGRDPKKDVPDHELSANLTFTPGDPPHGSVDFVIDPTKLPEALTDASTDGSGKRKMKQGPWSVVARIAKDRREVFAGKEHIRERSGIQILSRPLRVLLVTSGPMREYQTLRTMLVREVQANRAELSILMQSESGSKGEVVQDVPPERMLTRFPNLLDTAGKTDIENKFYNLNEYDLIIAFDPDWGEMTEDTIKNLQTWVNNLGGGLILVADNQNTFQLARAETNSRLSPILELLPVIPDDIVVQQVRPIPKNPRRLVFQPAPDGDLLKLSADSNNPDPTAGWEMFFTRREKFVRNPDEPLRDLSPPRGFFSSYPVKMVKPGAQTLAELADIDEKGEQFLRPWLVITQPARGRTAYIGSPELYRIRAIDPTLGAEYHQRFWIKLARYISANRDVKAARGRVLLNKEYISGSPIRLQARVLSPKGTPYAVGEKEIKSMIVPLTPTGDRVVREDPVTKLKTQVAYGPYPLAAKKSSGEFDGYYQTEVTADPKIFPPGENRYRVVIEVPDSPGDTIEGEFMIRKSDPELDRRQPDFAALLTIASEFDASVQARVADNVARERLLASLKKEAGQPKLAFHVSEKDLISLIPACMKTEERNFRNRGAIQDLWDRPAYLTIYGQPIRLLDFDLTRSRVLFVLFGLLGATLGIGLVRGLWEGVTRLLPNFLATVIASVWVLAFVLGATVPFFTNVEGVDGWICVLGLAATAWMVIICRLNVGPAYITLGVQFLAFGLALGLFLLFGESEFAYHVTVGVALLTIVGLLSTEWLTRKLLRLA